MAWKKRKRPVCRSCGSPIVFVSLVSGSRMPCNPGQVIVPDQDELDHGHAPAPSKLVVRDQTGTGTVLSQPPPGTVGLVSHFATCPSARAHSKRPKPKTFSPGQVSLF